MKLTREGVLTHCLLYYIEHNPNYWDAMDDIEDEIAKITGETDGEVNVRVHKMYQVGVRSCYTNLDEVKRNLIGE